MLATLLLFGSSALPLLDEGASARPQTAREMEAALARTQSQQGSLREQVDRNNREVDQLVGQVSALRVREAASQARLDTSQARLDDATAALKAEESRLAQIRERLQRAITVLEERIVEIYKSNDPDVLAVVLNSTDFADMQSRVEYLRRVKMGYSIVVERVHDLREQSEAAVQRLNAAQDRFAAARDAIATERSQLAAMRSSLEVRETKLRSARRTHEQQLAWLNRRANRLEGDLASLAPGEPLTKTTFATTPGGTSKLGSDGLAIAPANAPRAIKAVISAANQVAHKPYLWGGGHGSFAEAPGYDCSGAVSFALHGGGLLSSPMVSGGFETYGQSGPGRWISTYANGGHMYAIIAGLRFDTSGTGGAGPRWQKDTFGRAGFVVRHPVGY